VLSNSEFLPSEKEFFDFLKIRFATVGLEFDELNDLGIIDRSMQVSEKRFSSLKTKYFMNPENTKARFVSTHYSGHALILYQIARECFLIGRSDLAEKVYFLNIATTATDLYYEIGLPLRTGCDHPFGTVIGRAEFTSEASLYFNQQCTLGGNLDSHGVPRYPKIDGSLFLHPRASLVGENYVSGLVILSNSTYVKDFGELRDCLIFGVSPNLVVKPLSSQVLSNHSFFS
jgi:serine O-acetyltransferase